MVLVLSLSDLPFICIRHIMIINNNCDVKGKNQLGINYIYIVNNCYNIVIVRSMFKNIT